MKNPIRVVRSALKHTRLVASGSPPLYRLMVVGAVISGIIQAANGQASIAVADNSFPWFDYAFITIQLLAAVGVLLSLYMIDGTRYDAAKLHRSLNIEFISLILLQTAIAVNVTAAGFFNDGIPPAQGTWFTIMFFLWALTRLWEIRRAIGDLTRCHPTR